MVYYEIVHIRPDKKEVVIALKYDAADIPRVTNKFQWRGTWLTPDRKLLRYGRGELVIREKIKQPRITGCTPHTIGTSTWFELAVKYHDELHTIYLNDKVITGHSKDQKVLWSTTSLSELADKLIGKELAYQCMRYQEKFVVENAKGAV